MIEWNQEDLKDPNNDLCSKVTITVYIDVIRRYDGTWSAMVDHKRIAEGLSTREDAMQFLETFLVFQG